MAGSYEAWEMLEKPRFMGYKAAKQNVSRGNNRTSNSMHSRKNIPDLWPFEGSLATAFIQKWKDGLGLDPMLGVSLGLLTTRSLPETESGWQWEEVMNQLVELRHEAGSRDGENPSFIRGLAEGTKNRDELNKKGHPDVLDIFQHVRCCYCILFFDVFLTQYIGVFEFD